MFIICFSHTFSLGLHMTHNFVVGKKSLCGCPKVWELNSIFMQTCFFLSKWSLPFTATAFTNVSFNFHCHSTLRNTAWQAGHGYEGEHYVILRLFEEWPWFTENTKPQQSHRRLFLNCPSSVKVALTSNLCAPGLQLDPLSIFIDCQGWSSDWHWASDGNITSGLGTTSWWRSTTGVICRYVLVVYCKDLIVTKLHYRLLIIQISFTRTTSNTNGTP